MRKGVFVEISATTFLIIIGIVILLISLIVFASLTILKKPSRISQEYEFVVLNIRPYSLAESLLVYKSGFRTVAEHAIQSSVANALIKSDSQVLLRDAKTFMDFYGFNYYNVEIIKGDKQIAEIKSTGRRCGENDAGFCVVQGCGTARKEIDDKGKCAYLAEICCTEDRDIAGNYPDFSPPGVEVKKCGSNRGVCDVKCTEGRVKIDADPVECKDVNNGKTPECCAPLEDVGVELGILSKVEVPLLYKDQKGVQNFYCIDTGTTKCPGETVAGFCDDAIRGIACCITSHIRCSTPSGNGFCREVVGCVKDEGVPFPSKDCPESTYDNYKCCVGAKDVPPEGSIDESAYGLCTFAQDKQMGRLVITVGEKI